LSATISGSSGAPDTSERAAARCRSRSAATLACASAGVEPVAVDAIPSSASVTPLIAETTTAGPRPSRARARRTISINRAMASGSATDVPPNFCTTNLTFIPRIL